MYNSISTFVSLCSYNQNRCYFRRIFSDRGPGFGPVQSEKTELRTGPNWTNTSGSSDRTEPDYAARASNWTEPDQPPQLARTMVRSGPCRALMQQHTHQLTAHSQKKSRNAMESSTWNKPSSLPCCSSPATTRNGIR